MTSIGELRARDPVTGDPMIDLCDVATMNEILLVRYTNEKKAHEAAAKKSKPKIGR